MPCCCATYVQAAKVIGIIFVVLNLLLVVAQLATGYGDNDDKYITIVSGIVGALISGILVYGAQTRNRTAILIWMILTIIESIGDVIIATYDVSKFAKGHAKFNGIKIENRYEGNAMIVILILTYVGLILFNIWTLIVAKNARREIEEPDMLIYMTTKSSETPYHNL